MSEKQSGNGGEVIVEVGSDETNAAKGSSSTKQSDADLRVSTKSFLYGFPSPDNSRATTNSGKPPKSPNLNEGLNRRGPINRSSSKKYKSRFGEQSPVVNEDGTVGPKSPRGASFNRASPNNISGGSNRVMSVSSARNAPQSPGRTKDREDEEIYNKVKLSKKKRGKMGMMILIELTVFLCILGCLVATLTVQKLKDYHIWELEIWKWCVLVMVIFSGMLVTKWVMHFIVFVIEHNFLLKKKVLYFVHGMKRSVQVFLWLSLVLLTWLLVFNSGAERSKNSDKILEYVTWSIVSVLIGAFLWMLKTLLLKILASTFHVNTFFDRIQESIFHQYVLQTLSGPPLMEEADGQFGRSHSSRKLNFKASKKAKAGKEKQVIDMRKLQKIKQEKVSSWTMKVLVDAVTSSGLSTISNTMTELEGQNEQNDKEITSEMEATAAAYEIFLNVVPMGGVKYIEECDLLRFMIEEEVELVWPLIDVSQAGKVDRKTLTEWVVKVYNGRKALAHSLTDTKTAVKQLNKLVTCLLVVITILVWLLLTGIATTKILVFLSSQLLVAAFIFGNTCKTIFEAIIFVFVMHPFDVGDRCVVDAVQLLVEEMNILTTVFLKLNKEKVYYPNSVLSTKAITNYYRSSDMADKAEFSIAFTTPVEKIGELRAKVKEYVESNPILWHPTHQIGVVEIENLNKLKMELIFNHTMNFQDWPEKQRRRSEMIIALKKSFEDLEITYYLLPQDVHLTQTK